MWLHHTGVRPSWAEGGPWTGHALAPQPTWGGRWQQKGANTPGVRPLVRGGGWYHKRVRLLECGEQRKPTPTTGSTTAGRPAGETNHHTTTHPTRCVHTTRTQLSRSIVPHAAHSSQRQDSGTQGQRPTQGLFLKALGASVMWLLGTGPPTLHRPGDQLCRSTGASHRQAGGSHTTSPCTTTGHPTASEHTNTRHSTRGKPASTHTPGTHHTTRQGKPRCGPAMGTAGRLGQAKATGRSWLRQPRESIFNSSVPLKL